ncbi:MAG: hypothetical protein ACFFD4_22370 [Candidatus Odinarchaeota archaeon]
MKRPVSKPAETHIATTSFTSSTATTTTAPGKISDLCMNCGSVLRGGSKYCLNCGTDNSKLSLSTSTGPVFDKEEEGLPETIQPAEQTNQDSEIEETDSTSDPAAKECFEGLEEIRYYVKELETDASKLTATSSLYSGPLGNMHWKFNSSGIELATTSKTKIQRSFALEFVLDKPVSYQYNDPFAGIIINCSDENATTSIKRESRIAEKISKHIPPLLVKATVSPGQVDIKITAALERKNITSMFNLAKDLGWFFDITLR